MSDHLPLARMRVIDLTRVLSGPFCSMILADLGAEVIKVETPGEGDPVRAQGDMRDGLSWYFASFNRNKKSITLNLRDPAARDILRKLLTDADAVVENYRPDVMAAMGFGPEELAKINPRLVSGSISGFGATGPYKDRPSFDFIAQAMSGFMSLNGPEGTPPVRAGNPISDLAAGLYCALGVVSLLLRRERGGAAGAASTSLTGAMIGMLGFAAANHLATGKLPPRTGNDHPVASPYGMFRTSDGEIAIAPPGEAMYRRLLNALDAEELAGRPEFATNADRFANRAAINAEIEARTMRHTTAHWIDVLNAGGVPCGPVMNLAEVFADPQNIAQPVTAALDHPGYGMVEMLTTPLRIDGAVPPLRTPSPGLGEHTDEVLGALGIAGEEIATLRARGVI
ncbi:MAG: CoA transferase [Acetobacteraceae bacterium]|nr:CoA transferase [Acetobacteraceae bacterium]MSP31189.1 CoA transferase [Acetobacteraceae bacterium]